MLFRSWADGETSQNSPGGELHANFQLARSGEAIGLSTPDGALIDSVTFGSQTNDVSQGRLPDGGSQIVYMPVATPRASNRAALPNTPPSLAAIADIVVKEGARIEFAASARDAETASDKLKFKLTGIVPKGATIE